MASLANPTDTRAYILERLVGDTGEPDLVVEAGRALGLRAVAQIVERIGEISASPIGIELSEVEVSRFANARPMDTVGHAMTIASSTSSPDAMVFLIDPTALAIIVTGVFGGDLGEGVAAIARALSPTELEIASTVFGAVAEVLNGSGERAFNLRFPLLPAITGADMEKQVIRDGPAVRIAFSIHTPTSRGTLSVLLPQRVLLKHRGDAVAAGAEEWRNRFNDEVMRSAVSLEACMPLGTLTLGGIAGMQVGQTLELAEGAQSSATLSARGKTLFVCEFGKLGQNYTVRIKQPFDAGQDLIDTLVPA